MADIDFDAYVEAHESTSQVQLINGNNALEQNIKKLVHGRITVTVESPLVMKAKLKELDMVGELTPAGQLSEPSNMYIACSPAKAEAQQYVRWVDEGTRKLRESGELKNIMEKYGLSDWSGAQ